MKKELHRFTIRTAPELRESEGKRYIRGLIPYDSPSEWMGYTEFLAPTAFNKTIADGADVKALRNHDSNMILGRTKNGTLRLENSEGGLIPEIEINEGVSYAMDLWAAVQRKDVDTMSFGFIPIQQEIKKTDDGEEVRITEARLIEVSFGVPFPAYPETGSEAVQRSLEEVLAAQEIDEAGAILLTETKAKIDEALARRNPPSPEPPASTQADTGDMDMKTAVTLALID
jgi:HK97 family phage prohead protease